MSPRYTPLILVFAAAGTLQAQVAPAARTAESLAMYPLTTTSDAARQHMALAMRDNDMARAAAANGHFLQAVSADPSLALAHLGAATTSPSLDAFRTHLEHAEARAPASSESERLLVEIERRGFSGDREGMFELAQRLTQLQPANPRAWLVLAGAQAGLGREADARTTLQRAAQVAPRFAPVQIALSEAFLRQPQDAARALEHANTAVQLEPQESLPYDIQGDVHRAMGQWALARDAYTRGAALAPTEASLRQQRGHANTFLGAYDQARADYDAAMSLGKGNEPSTFGVWRAVVSVHEGNPQAAVQELQRLSTATAGMSIPDPDGTRIFILEELALIAVHHDMFDVAEGALAERTRLMRGEAARVGRDEFRRGTEANIAVSDGMLAARRGDHARATTLAQEAMRLLEPERNPRKNEPVHSLLGFVALRQGHHAEAADHFSHGDPNDIYNAYHLGLALEGAGRSEEARAQFQRVARYGFNSAGLALVRRAALAKIGQ
jgi:tetratricopeptide (TPR) repeat protein